MMKKNGWLAALLVLLCLLFAGCSGEPSISGSNPSNSSSGREQITSGLPSDPSQAENPKADGIASDWESSDSGPHEFLEIDRNGALSLALQNAGVPKEDAYNIKVERDRENGIPIFQVEFETQYGDYDFEIAVANGRIIGADYEVDEEWLDTIGGNPITLKEAKSIVQGKVPGSNAEDVHVWEEHEDGRGRLEGELFYNGIKYEFEIDPQTGMIYDWNADLRE